MITFLIILTFIAFAALMISRRMPAILAVPAMAVIFAAIVQTPLSQILNQVIAAGSTRLADAYMTRRPSIFAGAILGVLITRPREMFQQLSSAVPCLQLASTPCC